MSWRETRHFRATVTESKVPRQDSKSGLLYSPSSRKCCQGGRHRPQRGQKQVYAWLVGCNHQWIDAGWRLNFPASPSPICQHSHMHRVLSLRANCAASWKEAKPPHQEQLSSLLATHTAPTVPKSPCSLHWRRCTLPSGLIMRIWRLQAQMKGAASSVDNKGGFWETLQGRSRWGSLCANLRPPLQQWGNCWLGNFLNHLSPPK